MQYVRALIESRPYLSRIPDQNLVNNALDGSDRIVATRGDGYAFIYSAQGRKFAVDLSKLGAAKIKTWWYNPRTGTAADAGTLDGTGTREFACPAEGFGSDWVLVLDDASKNFAAPGAKPATR
jgi:hypothetical protein